MVNHRLRIATGSMRVASLVPGLLDILGLARGFPCGGGRSGGALTRVLVERSYGSNGSPYSQCGPVPRCLHPNRHSYDFIDECRRFLRGFEEPESSSGDEKRDVVPVTLLSSAEDFKKWFGMLSDLDQERLEATGSAEFKPGRAMFVSGPSADAASRAGYCFCLEEPRRSPWQIGSLQASLQPGKRYAFQNFGGKELSNPEMLCLSWALSGYSFDRYCNVTGNGKYDGNEGREEEVRKRKTMMWPEGVDRDAVEAMASSMYLVRDLITTPTEDLGPAHMEDVFMATAKEFGAQAVVICDENLEKNYPQVHAVGRAAEEGREPRLLDMVWGNESHPLVTLVGKGVCYDTGGLSIKPTGSMVQMKKDMGGGAIVLGLARLVMTAGLKVRLRVLIPTVENAISGCAYRPGDVLTARSGKTTEITNTDAEGRLILADALVEASQEHPDLIIDCATLTGAARVALGLEIPAVFCNDEELARDLLEQSKNSHDECWRLPLWESYRSSLSSKIADLQNSAPGGAGAITAALYLDEFIVSKNGKKPSWIHMDLMGFQPVPKPGRPVGGEAQGMRALFALLQHRYS